MTDLLTRAEYRAIADRASIPAQAFIDGAFRPAKDGGTMASTDPSTGDVIADIAACGPADIDFAVERSRRAFVDGRWRTLNPGVRKDVLIRLCKLIARNRRDLAVLESLDSGKPIRDCEEIDIPETIATIAWHAELIDKIYDQTAPTGDDALAIVVREPIGVVGAVIPWNFPLLMLAWKIGPALAAGNSVIVKPAEQTSITALRVAELAAEAGVPDGVLNVVPGRGSEAGQALGLHDDADMVTFTGSTDTGRRFLRYAADSNLKRIVLECGGKNPVVVLEDACDLDYIARKAVEGAFWNMGENCSASSRLIVHKHLREPLLDRVVENVAEWRTGDPMDPVNHLGPLVDSEHVGKVSAFLDRGREEGVRTVVGGEVIDGRFVVPTVFDGVDPSSALAREEIFGPVLSVLSAPNDDV
ncbi:MAG: aldehyde dehydrogenase family protein, partial [Acidimicrobiia bacterium]|nr:aldehyde dehydrogenase family protein [Acidimicrobiia bacterium]